VRKLGEYGPSGEQPAAIAFQILRTALVRLVAFVSQGDEWTGIDQ
jgi:hypothetical protein